ncbi:hypothetical protein K7432_007526 [Basidiobolus ranarum]|uniref:RRM domain-containing protein n=1 Tax=Basidiobolus ranarum TaxID=34480 RepID=A0ABR2VZY6_9FUNG
MSQIRNSRVVFVGNIPYDLTEEQLIDIFKEVGPVVSFRLVFDRESGKPRGYGFCEFLDAETASSAPRGFGQASGNSSGPPSVESISSTISSMNNNQLTELMIQMKLFAQQSPEQARSVMSRNPQLAYGLFQAMLTMNLVDPNVLQRLVNQPPNQAKTSNVSAPSATGFSGQIDPTPKGPQAPPVAAQSRAPQAPSVPVSSVGGAGPGAPPGMSDSLEEQQRALLMQILSLTPQQIDSLPPDQRQHILQLKAQIMMGQGQT